MKFRNFAQILWLPLLMALIPSMSLESSGKGESNQATSPSLPSSGKEDSNQAISSVPSQSVDTRSRYERVRSSDEPLNSSLSPTKDSRGHY